nr:MAG TPA: hypothetical protein [Caudoviricetes sp.]
MWTQKFCMVVALFYESISQNVLAFSAPESDR